MCANKISVRKLPKGIQDFERLRREEYLYADKTDMVWQIANGDIYNYLSRPRRFGKSLLASTLQCYFEGKKELFADLKIMQMETAWTVRPVFHFDLSEGGSSNEKLIQYLSDMLVGFEKQYNITDDISFLSLGVRFRKAIERAHEQTGQLVAILIDEYDAPLQHTLFADNEHDKCKETYRDFFAILKSANAHIFNVFITGITKFTQLSLFSVLNNLTNLSFKPEYAAVCGLTEDEITSVFQPEVERLGEVNGWDLKETIGHLQDMYNGYHFSRTGCAIFNPYSVIHALADGELINYWASSGASSLLNKVLSRSEELQEDMENFRISRNVLQTSDVSIHNTPLFLYQTGYLTIKDYYNEQYTLGIPNKEVREALYEMVLPEIVRQSHDVVQACVSRIKDALFRNDPEKIMLNLKQLVAETPYGRDRTDEKVYEARFRFILKNIFYLCGCNVREEQQMAGGIIDLVVVNSRCILVLELKLEKNGGVIAAGKQLIDRGYAKAYCAEGLPLYEIAIEFDTRSRGLSAWKIAKY